MSGDVHVRFCEGLGVRFPGATHFVMGFQHREEAERFLEQLRERLAEYGRELHPAKTRLIEFGLYAAERRKRRGEGKPETFEVKRKTMAKRLRGKLRGLKQQLKRRRHEPDAEPAKWPRPVVTGYFQYRAVPGNWARLKAFRKDVWRLWLRMLRRRSQRRRWTWKRFIERLGSLLPEIRIPHPYPNVRFDAKYPR